MQSEIELSTGQIIEITANDQIKIRAQVLGPSDAPRLIVSHGNGLAAGGYESFWRHFVSDHQVVLLDFRGHGKSDRGSEQNHSWEQFVLDYDVVMKGIREQLGERRTIGAFHSLSAIVSLMHAQRFGPSWDALVLFDPPIIPPDGHPMQKAHITEMMTLAERVARRRSHFDAWEELAGQFRRSPAFVHCQPEACDEMARALLQPSPEDEGGNWRLSCIPEREAKIFATNDDTSVWSWLGEINFPIKLLCADPDVPHVQPSAAIGQHIAQEFGLAYACVPGTTHFLQMERPDLCASLTREFAETVFDSMPSA